MPRRHRQRVQCPSCKQVKSAGYAQGSAEVELRLYRHQPKPLPRGTKPGPTCAGSGVLVPADAALTDAQVRDLS